MKHLALLLVLAACPAPGAPATSPSPPPAAASRSAPRLVVLLVIDQLPQWAFAQKRPHLTAGFDRVLREGEWQTGRHPSAGTLTAVGHAVLGTGEPPATSGIIANEWWHRELDRMIGSVESPEGGPPSAIWLRVPALGDAIAHANTGAKAVSVSLKDRASILPLGKAGTPIWYDPKAPGWTSTVALGWLAEHDRNKPIASRFDYVWTPLDAARLAELSGTTDDQHGELGERGFGKTFPHALRATADPAGALLATPLGNELVFEIGVAAIDREHLGADAVPDLLVLSLSAHDYVGHGWGHESWEAWDVMLRLDQQLAGFLEALDAKVGAHRWAMVVTSDHGASPLPERIGGGRITHEALLDAARRAAITVLGPGDWVSLAKFPSVYLSPAARARSPEEQQRVITEIIHALRSFPGLGRVERTADFAGACETRGGEARTICLGLDRERTGEVFFLPARGWIFEREDKPQATAHNSLHAYDLEVPVLVVEPGRTAHAPRTAPSRGSIPMVQIATVLARWLGVTPPSALPRTR